MVRPSLALTPAEIAVLKQKGLIRPPAPRAAATPEKEVLDLVRLSHPDGWSVLLAIASVTPDLARRWLETNFDNRPVSEDTVTAYARDAAAGMFLTTHQGIAFNDLDRLIDGQHRLLAIVRSNVACNVLVSFGWISEIKGRAMKRMDVIDRGRPRSVADQLKIQHGLKNGAAIAQITTQLANLCCPERTRRLSVGQALEIYRAFEAAVEWVIAHRSKEHGLKSAGVLAAFAFARAAVGRDSVEPLFHALNSGEALADKPAIRKLREFLVSDDGRLLMRGHDRGIAEVTLRALLGQKMLPGPEGVDHFRALQQERADQIAALFRLPAKTEDA